MSSLSETRVGGIEVLEHGLNQYFPELLKFESTPEMERSELWAKIKPEAERILNSVVVETGYGRQETGEGEDTGRNATVRERANNPQSAIRDPQLEGSRSDPQMPDFRPLTQAVRTVAWNIERGIQLDGIIEALKHHEKLKDKDLLLLTELDYGMARSGNRYVAGEIAEALNLNYAFAPVYIALQKGSGVESAMEGENTHSIHGLAMFSRYPMTNVHAIPLPNGKDKMWGKEKRLGHLRALFADIEYPAGAFRAITVHLDAHCSRQHRRLQMKLILDHLDTLPPLPTIIGGDWNTTTFNSQSSTRAIMGYWRRVFMGPKNVAQNHLPHPERFFEKPLFTDLEKRGYRWRDLNNVGEGTLHYQIDSIEKNTNLRDWVPEWCFPFIFWAAGRVGGSVSGRLDWFTGKDIVPSNPQTIGELKDAAGTPLSDHDAIGIDFDLK